MADTTVQRVGMDDVTNPFVAELLSGSKQAAKLICSYGGTWKPCMTPGKFLGRCFVRNTKVVQDWDVGRSKSQSVMDWIKVAISPYTKVSPRPTGSKW